MTYPLDDDTSRVHNIFHGGGPPGWMSQTNVVTIYDLMVYGIYMEHTRRAREAVENCIRWSNEPVNKQYIRED